MHLDRVSFDIGTHRGESTITSCLYSTRLLLVTVNAEGAESDIVSMVKHVAILHNGINIKSH